MYSYSKPKGKKSLLKTFISAVKPLAVATCMRHLYIFNNEQLQGATKHLTNLQLEFDNPPLHHAKTEYQILDGAEAYTFLLYWLVGGLNKKNPFDDIRILGDLRKILYSVEHGKGSNTQKTWLHNKEVGNALRQDGKRLLKWVQSLPKEMAIDKKEALVMQACTNCTWARQQGLLEFIVKFDYSYLASKELMMQYIDTQLKVISEKANQVLERTSRSLGSIGFLFSLSRPHLELRIEQAQQYQETLFQDEVDEALVI